MQGDVVGVVAVPCCNFAPRLLLTECPRRAPAGGLLTGTPAGGLLPGTPAACRGQGASAEQGAGPAASDDLADAAEEAGTSTAAGGQPSMAPLEYRDCSLLSEHNLIRVWRPHQTRRFRLDRLSF